MKICHHGVSLYTITQGSSFWRPVSANVKIQNVTAHAEIPTTATAHWPVSLDEVRMRYLKGDEWTVPRKSVIYEKTELDDWNALCTDQGDGEQTKELPSCKLLYGCAENVWQNLKYDKDSWVDKRVADEEFFEFGWRSEGGPWRHVEEHEQDVLYRRPRLVGQTASVGYNDMINLPRFDYLYGCMDTPLCSRVMEFGKLMALNRCIYNKRPLPLWWTQHMGKGTLNDTDMSTYEDMKNSTELFQNYNQYISNFANAELIHGQGKTWNAAMPSQIYSSPNQMKPIYIAFSRFMRDNNIQPYRVYFDVEITHTIELLKNKQSERNRGGQFQTADNGNQQNIPSFVFSVPAKNAPKQDMNDFDFFADVHSFPVYNPWEFNTLYRTGT